MKDNQILEHIKNSINEAPIDLLEKIKNQEIEKMENHDDITRQKAKVIPLRPISYLVSAAAVFFLVFLNYQINFIRPDSQIYLDLNPSINITTNRRDKVISLDGINIDGSRIVENIDYKNKDVYLVAEEIIDSMVDKSYIEEENEVMLLSIYNKDSDKSNRQRKELDTIIHEKLKDINRNPILLTQSLDGSNTIEEFAEKYNISVGKMTFIRNLIILNPDLETDDLVNLSMSQLIYLARENKLDIDKIIDSEDFERIPQASPDVSERISPDEARRIALGRVNGTITDFEYDEDDRLYEIEIKYNGKDYDIEIDAYTGEIVKFEVDDDDDYDDDDDDYDDDYDDDDDDDDDTPSNLGNSGRISPDEARRIALGRVNGTITDFEYDDDDNVYEIEIEYDGKEYELEIDGSTGRILEFEVDDDD